MLSGDGGVGQPEPALSTDIRVQRSCHPHVSGLRSRGLCSSQFSVNRERVEPLRQTVVGDL